MLGRGTGGYEDIGSQDRLCWKRALGSPGTTYVQRHHGTQCHIQSFLNTLRGSGSITPWAVGGGAAPGPVQHSELLDKASLKNRPLSAQAVPLRTWELLLARLILDPGLMISFSLSSHFFFFFISLATRRQEANLYQFACHMYNLLIKLYNFFFRPSGICCSFSTAGICKSWLLPSS